MAPIAGVFTGPTISPAEADRLLEADYLPPASQGSVVRYALERRPCAILLVDGVFQGEPTVRHKEILWALSRGISVYGAASMGALRASELHEFGMVGIGLIYRWYRRYPLAPDDAVAVLHGPPELGSPPLTTALVDLRFTLRAAERAGVVDRALSRRLEHAASGLNFRDRTLDRVVAEALCGAAPSEAADLRRAAPLLPTFLRNQKRRDAEVALSRLADDLRDGSLPRPERGSNFVMTSAFLQDLRDAGIELS